LFGKVLPSNYFKYLIFGPVYFGWLNSESLLFFVGPGLLKGWYLLIHGPFVFIFILFKLHLFIGCHLFTCLFLNCIKFFLFIQVLLLLLFSMQVPFFIRSFLFIQVFFLLGSFTFHLINLLLFYLHVPFLLDHFTFYLTITVQIYKINTW